MSCHPEATVKSAEEPEYCTDSTCPGFGVEEAGGGGAERTLETSRLRCPLAQPFGDRCFESVTREQGKQATGRSATCSLVSDHRTWGRPSVSTETSWLGLWHVGTSEMGYVLVSAIWFPSRDISPYC